jgi:hypothetical protein
MSAIAMMALPRGELHDYPIIFPNCCTNIHCLRSGKIQVTGDTGLVLDIIVKDVALEC